MQALIGLVGAIVGGLLVILGDHFSQRRQTRMEMLRLAWENAAEVVANKRSTASQAVTARSQGRPSLNDDELKALADADRIQDVRFYMLPVPEKLRVALRAVNRTSRDLIAAIPGDDELWVGALQSQRQAIYDFEAMMRVHLGARSPDLVTATSVDARGRLRESPKPAGPT